MKKALAFVISFILLIAFAGVSLAEFVTIDFSGYSLEELIQIKMDLMDEIAKRPNGEKMTMGSGQYRIGEDLPAGVYSFKFAQNGDMDIDRTDYYVYENESMYKYDVDRLWLGDMPRLEGALKGDGETRISLYPGEFLSIRYNGAVVERVGNITERETGYEVPSGTTIPKGNYTIGEEIPAGTYKIYYNGKSTARVHVFQDAEEASNTFNKGKETILDESNPEGIVALTEGNVLRVEYTPIIMTKGGGFNFD